MRLLPFLLTGVSVFALCNYYWIPTLERNLRSSSFIKSTGWGSILAWAGLLRSLVLINILALFLIIIVVGILKVTGGGTLTSTTSAIRTIETLRPWLVGFSPTWSLVAIFTIVIALSVYAYRRGKKRWEPAFTRVFEEEVKRLESERNQVAELLPRRRLSRLESRINKVERKIIELNWKESAHSNVSRRKEKLAHRLRLLRKRYQILELQQRTQRPLEREDSELPKPQKGWKRIQTLIMSRGLFVSLDSGARASFLLLFILMVPFLVGAYGTVTDRMLNDRLSQIHDLRVHLDATDWEKTKQLLGAPTNELSEDDKRILENVALAFETAVPIPPPSPAMLKEWYAIHSMAVREEILKRAASRTPIPLEAHVLEPQIAGLNSAELATLNLYKDATASRHPSTQLGKEIYGKLEDVARRSSLLMNRIRQADPSLRRLGDVYDIRRQMLTKIMSGPSKETPSQFENLLATVDINQPLFSLAQQDRARKFVADLIVGKDSTESLINVGTITSPRYRESSFESREYETLTRNFRDQLPVDRINVKAALYPASVDALPEKDLDLTTAVTKVEELLRYAKGPHRSRDQVMYADSLARYEDYFPSQLEINYKTDRGKIALRLYDTLPRSVVIDGIGATVVGNVGSAGSFLRAHSFSELRDFSRIGGVLIGREPSDVKTSKLDCTNLEWEADGKSLHLVLTTADGRRIRSRAHSMTLIYQALNYAADGRPVAVTMVDARPVPELKILLHPTLIDTALGYRMINLDTFVDGYVPQEDPTRKQAEKRIGAQRALYEFAWANRGSALSRFEPDYEWDTYIKGIINDQATQKLVQEALSEYVLLADPKHSPLTLKREFFDSTLVDLILQNARPDISVVDFGQAIQHQALLQYTKAAYSESKLEELRERWSKPYPRFRTWAGVREKEFESDSASLVMVDGSSSSMPLEFILQLSFISPPEFPRDDNSKDANNSLTWDYPSLKDYIQDHVLQGISDTANSRHRAVLNDAGEFTMLQRMFRMAFNGHLGMKFPVEKLVALSDVAAAGMPMIVERTLRWQPESFDSDEADQPIIPLAKELRLSLGVEKDYAAEKAGYWARFPLIER